MHSLSYNCMLWTKFQISIFPKYLLFTFCLRFPFCFLLSPPYKWLLYQYMWLLNRYKLLLEHCKWKNSCKTNCAVKLFKSVHFIPTTFAWLIVWNVDPLTWVPKECRLANTEQSLTKINHLFLLLLIIWLFIKKVWLIFHYVG